jgi:hypothetical protein
MMRNIRIQRGARLNPSCAIEARLESMLRTDTPLKTFFSGLLVLLCHKRVAVTSRAAGATRS